MSRRSIILNWPIVLFRGAAFHSNGGRILQISRNLEPPCRPLRIFRNTKAHSLIKPYILRTFVRREIATHYLHFDVGDLESNYGNEITGDRLHLYKMNRESTAQEKIYTYNAYKAKVDQVCSVRFTLNTKSYSKRTFLNYNIWSLALASNGTLYTYRWYKVRTIAGSVVLPRQRAIHTMTPLTTASLLIRYTTSLHFNRKMCMCFSLTLSLS